MEQENQTQDAVVQDASTQDAAPVGLTLQDLRVVAGSIELGAQRGAFRAPEMEIIGATYNKLALFLKANVPADEAPADDAATAPAEVTAEA